MSDPPPAQVTFDDVVNYLSDPELIGDFPHDVLKDRLRSIGTEEALEKNAIAQYGFPFRYNHPLDEVILVLNSFLTKSKQIEGSYIQINSTHVPTREEENTLSFWKSPKAGLYLDLHALIENHNHRQGKTGFLKRVFVFRDHAQLAFIESTGIGVILEQESIGIETGFLLTMQHEGVAEITRGGVVLVQLLHEEDEKCEWFLAIDKTDPAQQPYENYLICKWHRGRVLDKRTRRRTEKALKESNIDLKKYFDIFRFEDREPEFKTEIRRSYRFESQPEPFRRLLKANYQRAFPKGEVSKDEFEKHLDYRAIPENLEQLCLALEQIKQSSQIKAIDASSVKSTLKVHEADPNYRHWIRTTVQRALKNRDTVSLDRVYILREVRDEYAIFKQEVELYRDLITNRISRLDPMLDAAQGVLQPGTNDSPNNIRLYAITMEAVDDICRATDEEARTALAELLREDFKRKEETKVSSTMSELDFLYSERLVFNYKDYKGEPGRAFYEADLFVPLPYGHTKIDKSKNGKPIVTHLDSSDFEDKRSKYSRLFDILKKRSIQVLPSDGRDFPTLDEFEQELSNKDIKAITMSEILEVTQLSAQKTQTTGTDEMRAKIFVSHAKDDRPTAQSISDRLEAAGHKTWIYPRDVDIGQEAIWVQNSAIAECDFFLVCHSENYIDKDGEIQAEVDAALQRAIRVPKDGRFMLVLLLDDYPVRHDLAKYSRAHLFKDGQWQEDVWQKLLESIAHELERRNKKRK